MNSLTPLDPEAGRAFFRRASLFVVALGPPGSGEPTRFALLGFAVDASADVDAFPEALEFARNAGGRYYAIVVERVALETEVWPTSEPPHVASYIAERDGFVVLAPSVDAWVTMPPARPHHLVQLVAAVPRDGEATARAELSELGTCGLVGRVRAVLDCGSGAEMDAVVCGPDGIKGGYFAQAADSARDVAQGASRVDESSAKPEANSHLAPLHEPSTASVLSSTRGVDRSALLNEALAAYVAPPFVRRNLETFLRDRDPEADAVEIRTLLDAAVSSTDDYLWGEKPHVTWSEAFEWRFFQHLRSRHPWLTQAGLAALLSYGKWLCWHEGLGG